MVDDMAEQAAHRHRGGDRALDIGPLGNGHAVAAGRERKAKVDPDSMSDHGPLNHRVVVAEIAADYREVGRADGRVLADEHLVAVHEVDTDSGAYRIGSDDLRSHVPAPSRE